MSESEQFRHQAEVSTPNIPNPSVRPGEYGEYIMYGQRAVGGIAVAMIALCALVAGAVKKRR